MKKLTLELTIADLDDPAMELTSRGAITTAGRPEIALGQLLARLVRGRQLNTLGVMATALQELFKPELEPCEYTDGEIRLMEGVQQYLQEVHNWRCKPVGSAAS